MIVDLATLVCSSIGQYRHKCHTLFIKEGNNLVIEPISGGDGGLLDRQFSTSNTKISINKGLLIKVNESRYSIQ